MSTITLIIASAAVILVAFHIFWSLTPKTDFSILQASSANFEGAIFSQRRPIVLEIPPPQPEVATIETLCRGHVWSRSGEYVLKPSEKSTMNVIRNRHKFMWLYRSHESTTSATIRLYSPNPVATSHQNMPFMEIIMRPNFALMIPRSWMFSVHGADVGMFYTDDVLTTIINWCHVVDSRGGSDGTNNDGTNNIIQNV